MNTTIKHHSSKKKKNNKALIFTTHLNIDFKIYSNFETKIYQTFNRLFLQLILSPIHSNLIFLIPFFCFVKHLIFLIYNNTCDNNKCV